MRLFAGLALPPSAIDRISKLRLRFAGSDDGLRWSDSAQWHITLRFFGELSEEQTGHLLQALGDLQHAPVEVSFDQLGLFRSKGILFLSTELTDRLRPLHAAIAVWSPGSDLVPDAHVFHPHITLARSRNRFGLRTLERLSTPELPPIGLPIQWRATSVTLYRSELMPGGARHTVLAEFPLR